MPAQAQEDSLPKLEFQTGLMGIPEKEPSDLRQLQRRSCFPPATAEIPERRLCGACLGYMYLRRQVSIILNCHLNNNSYIRWDYVSY